MRSPPGNGSAESRMSEIASNAVAPTAMATAIANAANDRQPAMLEQHAQAESRVEQQRVEPAQAVHVVPGLLVFLDAAEADQRAPAGFLEGESVLLRQAFRLHVDVETHLLVHLGGDAIAPGEEVPIG